MDRSQLPFRSEEKGTVIIIVLLVLATLSFLAMELSKETLIDYSSSISLKTTVSGNALCDSGLVLAKETLMKDLADTKADFRFETWGRFNEGLTEVSEELSTGTITGKILDENSLFPINNVKFVDKKTEPQTKEYRALLLRIVKQLCADLDITEAKPEDYLTSIRIWMGEELASASEDDAWYQEQEVEYRRPKRPLRSPKELLLIHWQNAEDGDVEKLFYGTKNIKGLRDIITVWGQGPINMNTAHDTIIEALQTDNKKNDELLIAINDYRNDPANNFEEEWYKKVFGFQGVSVEKLPKYILDIKSNTFRVELEASIGGGVKREFSIIRRTEKEASVLTTGAL